MISTNILIFTYKQQDFIKRAVDSILCQKEWGLNKIIVSDDCSPDCTWQILEDYKRQYPNIFEIYQNERNLGVYGNWNQMISRKGNADFYYILAGDDALCDGVLQQLQLKIEKESINVNDPVAIYFDWKYIKPDRTEGVRQNNMILFTTDAFGLKLRNRISNRSCFVSKGLMNSYQVVDIGHGMALAETLADIQYSHLAKSNFYVGYVGSVYYTGIGVSKDLFTKEYYKESIVSYDMFVKYYPLNRRDFAWVQYLKSKDQLCLEPNLKIFVRVIYYYILGEKYVSYKERFYNIIRLFKLYIRKLFSTSKYGY